MAFHTAVSAGCQRRFPAARKENAMENDCRLELVNFGYLTAAATGELLLSRHLRRWRDYMERKKRGRRREPVRYVVERVYAGTESMERLLTSVSEEAARRNVEEKLKSGGKNKECE